jgi:hypothetical protein
MGSQSQSRQSEDLDSSSRDLAQTEACASVPNVGVEPSGGTSVLTTHVGSTEALPPRFILSVVPGDRPPQLRSTSPGWPKPSGKVDRRCSSFR